MAVHAQTTVTITDGDLVGGQTYDWNSDTEYLLDGLVFLEEGSRLNIAAGTIIKGKATATTGDNTSALIIARGAQIFAEGTAESPIIFTAEEDDVNDPDDFDMTDRGEWGGLLILGNATIARPDGNDGIEGIDSDEDRARFGGDDDDDDSGVLRYVSIRHGGAQLSTDNEINGLTLGGVGSGTVIDYIEVFANLDDGIEWFGGTVKVNHAAVSFCGDDGMDYDYGWRGGGQFWFVLQGPNDGTGRSGEHDGASPDNLAPFSEPTIYNATYIGIGEGETATGGDATRSVPLSILFRDNAGGHYYNSVFTDFNGRAVGVEDRPDDDVDSYTRLQNGDLTICNSIFYGFGAGSEAADLFVAVNPDDEVVPASSAEVATLLTDCGNLFEDPVLNNIADRDEDGAFLDPRPYSFGGVASEGAPAAQEGFESVPYYGAFAPGAYGDQDRSWINGWTALSASSLVFDQTNATGDRQLEGLLLSSPVPNPASNLTRVNFELPRAGEVNLSILDLVGRPLALRTRNYTAGAQSESIDVSQLPNGTYLLVLDYDGSRLLQKLVVNR